jgi:hypothetical protein
MNNIFDELNNAYVELFHAVENGIDTDSFFKLREKFRSIKSKISDRVTISMDMKDWRIDEGDFDSMESSDSTKYKLECDLGNQSYINITDESGNARLELVIEINNGVPALHLAPSNDENLLHIHACDNAFILTPEDSKGRFYPSEVNRYTYNCDNALVIHYEE